MIAQELLLPFQHQVSVVDLGVLLTQLLLEPQDLGLHLLDVLLLLFCAVAVRLLCNYPGGCLAQPQLDGRVSFCLRSGQIPPQIPDLILQPFYLTPQAAIAAQCISQLFLRHLLECPAQLPPMLRQIVHKVGLPHDGQRCEGTLRLQVKTRWGGTFCSKYRPWQNAGGDYSMQETYADPFNAQWHDCKQSETGECPGANPELCERAWERGMRKSGLQLE